MIPVTNTIEQIDSLPGKKVEFGIGDPRWVMRSMADLYSNRVLAVVREYSTNAFDANREKALLEGHEIEPIEVSLPSMMDPFFVVRDYGYGMPMDVLGEVYTQFGTSTKRGSNNFNGMLGFGSKSAMAYTTSFTVTSIHNGMRIQAVIARRPDFSIFMTLMDPVPTDERSGTEIRVPVSDHQEFVAIANDFYKFWLPGTVKVNGVEPEHAVGEKITDGLYYSTHWNRSYVVMGNVPYRIENPQALFRNVKMDSINFVAYVDNGDVEFTPSREDLKYTEHTKRALHKVITDFEDKISAQAQSEIDNAATHPEAFKAWRKWTNVLGRSMFDDLTFKGDKFQSDFAVNGSRYDSAQYRGNTYTIRNWHVESMEKTLVVTEFTANLHSRHKLDAREYAKMKGWAARYFIFTGQKADEIESKWITKERFIKWEDLKAALPKAPRQYNPRTGPRRIPGTFDYITSAGTEFEKDLPSNITNLYYIIPADKDKNVSGALRMLKDDGVVVILGRNRIEKFKRENPQVKEFFEYAKSRVVIDSSSLLSEDAKTLLSMDYYDKNWAVALDKSKVDDPEIQRLFSLTKNESELLADYKANQRLAASLGIRYTVKDYSVNGESYIAKTYPLLTSLSYAGIHEHIYTYMNAVYQQKEKKINE